MVSDGVLVAMLVTLMVISIVGLTLSSIAYADGGDGDDDHTVASIEHTSAGTIDIHDDIHMTSNDVKSVNEMTVNALELTTLSGNGVPVNASSDFSLGQNDIVDAGSVTATPLTASPNEALVITDSKVAASGILDTDITTNTGSMGISNKTLSSASNSLIYSVGSVPEGGVTPNLSASISGFIASAGSGATIPYAAHVDNNNNSYVAGIYGSEVTFDGVHADLTGVALGGLVAKFNPEGSLLWLRSTDTYSGNIFMRDVTTDSMGNVYACGYTETSFEIAGLNVTLIESSTTFFLLKFSANGDPLWVKQTVSGGGGVRAYKLAIDSNDNVIMTGDIGSSDATKLSGDLDAITGYGGADLYVIKFSPNGQGLWLHQGILGASIDRSYDVAIGADDSVHITGYFTDSVTVAGTNLTGTGSEFFIAKLGADGGSLWAKNSISAGTVEGSSVVVDSSGNVYAMGHLTDTTAFGAFNVDPVGANRDAFIVKYNASGDVQWVKIAENNNVSDFKGYLAIDTINRLYVVGDYVGHCDIADTVLDGGTCYMACLDTSDGSGYWAVSGQGSSYDVAVTASGSFVQWGVATAAATTFDGLHVPHPPGTFDIFVVLKYNVVETAAVGLKQNNWAVQSSSGVTAESGTACAVDKDGNSYVAGYFSGTVTFGNTSLVASVGTNLFVVKYSPSGGVEWAITSTTSSADTAATALGVDSEGGVYVAGHFKGSLTMDTVSLGSGATKQSMFLMKISSSGVGQWGIQSTTGTLSERATALAISPNNDVFVTGYFDSDMTLDGTAIPLPSGGVESSFVARFDKHGTKRFAKGVVVSGTGDLLTSCIAANNEYAVVGGTFTGSVNVGVALAAGAANHGFEVVYAHDGTYTDYGEIDTETTGAAHVTGIVLADTGYKRALAGYSDEYADVNVSGGTISNVGTSGFGINANFAFVSSNLGSSAWVDYSTPEATDACRFTSLAKSVDHGLYTTGYFDGTITLGTYDLVSGGQDDMLFVKYEGLTGAPLAVRTGELGATGAERSLAIAVDAGNNAFVSGMFDGSVAVAGIPLTSTGDYDMFLAKFSYATYVQLQQNGKYIAGGVASGFSGLMPGAMYYLDGTELTTDYKDIAIGTAASTTTINMSPTPSILVNNY